MPALTRFSLLKHYSKPAVQEAILAECEHREVGISYGNKGYGKRPDMLQFKHDIYEFARQGATSFHVSLERWDDPLALAAGMQKRELDSIRTGWDLVFDIDSKFVEFSKIAAMLIIEAMESLGISRHSIGLKFSGNRGFHLCVPFESMPSTINMQSTTLLYPDAARAIIEYIKSIIADQLAQQLLQMNSAAEIAAAINKLLEEIQPKGVLKPFTIVDIDSQALSSRHLIRAPFSINEKSGLVSIPLTPAAIPRFQPAMARIDTIEPGARFFTAHEQSDATHLFIQAMDYAKRNLNIFTPAMHAIMQRASSATDISPRTNVGGMQQTPITQKIPEMYFPPCIMLALAGIKSDGRKRAVFILNNFLRNVGYTPQEVEQLLEQWNARNYQPLREGYIKTQLKWHHRNPTTILPPNCLNEGYYVSMGICRPDTFCPKIKNPAQYALKKFRLFQQQQKQPQPKRRASRSRSRDQPQPSHAAASAQQ